jgi:hypothetical protein
MARPNKDIFWCEGQSSDCESFWITQMLYSWNCSLFTRVINSMLIHFCSAMKKLRKHHCFGTVLKYIRVCMCVYVANGCVYINVSLHSCATKSTGMLGERGLELVVVLPLLRCCWNKYTVTVTLIMYWQQWVLSHPPMPVSHIRVISIRVYAMILSVIAIHGYLLVCMRSVRSMHSMRGGMIFCKPEDILRPVSLTGQRDSNQ